MKFAGVAILLIIFATPAFAAPAPAPASSLSGSGQALRLSRPTKIGVTALDKSKIIGQVIWHDAVGFELDDDKDKTRVVRWPELSAASAYEIYDRILGKGSPDDWLQAGWVLRNLPDGTLMSDRAFLRALNLDAKLQPQVDKAKTAAKPEGEPGENLLVKGWPHLTDAQHAAAVAAQKKIVADSAQTNSLKLYETKFFLFYTDLKPEEGARWASLLDKMYARLAEMFAIEAGKNIWQGKAVVIVFKKADEFRAYEKAVYKNDPGKSAGTCRWDGKGNVNIDFYRLDDELDFAHLLVHESTHGFLNRFRTPVNIPSWANEGLAEWMGNKLVPNKRAEDWRRDNAKKELNKGPIPASFFTAKQIELTQYGVAETLCAHMISHNPGGYVDFINGIKDGLPPEISLEKKYGASRDRLATMFRQIFLGQGGK